MSADQMERVSECAWLKAAVRDPKLQGLLVSAVFWPFFILVGVGGVRFEIDAVSSSSDSRTPRGITWRVRNISIVFVLIFTIQAMYPMS